MAQKRELQKWMQERAEKFFELGQKIDAKYPKRSGMEAEACIKEKMGMQIVILITLNAFNHLWEKF